MTTFNQTLLNRTFVPLQQGMAEAQQALQQYTGDRRLLAVALASFPATFAARDQHTPNKKFDLLLDCARTATYDDPDAGHYKSHVTAFMAFEAALRKHVEASDAYQTVAQSLSGFALKAELDATVSFGSQYLLNHLKTAQASPVTQTMQRKKIITPFTSAVREVQQLSGDVARFHEFWPEALPGMMTGIIQDQQALDRLALYAQVHRDDSNETNEFIQAARWAAYNGARATIRDGIEATPACKLFKATSMTNIYDFALNGMVDEVVLRFSHQVLKQQEAASAVAAR